MLTLGVFIKNFKQIHTGRAIIYFYMGNTIGRERFRFQFKPVINSNQQ